MPPPRAPAPAASTARGTTDEILDAAEHLVQTRGYNGFSYADVAAVVGVTTASLHYHFPAKSDLGRALVERYTRAFGAALESIGARERTARTRLRAYAALYVDVLERDRMCLCGMLAAEVSTLPEAMQRALRAFFDANEAWLTGVFADGRRAKEIAFRGEPRDAARLWTSALEGSLLLARSYGDVARLKTAVERLLEDLSAPPRMRR